VSRGDPDKAANVATFVPGAESNLSSAGRALQRADGLYTAAVRAGSPSTAVITWMNYDSPDSAATAPFNSSSADEAAPRLNTFQQGLLLTHDSSTSHNTLVGHSYGAKVAAQAASQPGQSSVDDVIGAGAFDLGGGPASDVHVDPGHVWVIEHQKDAAADINVHNDPSSPDFGARVYGAEPGPYRDKWAGLARLATDQPAHGNYFDNDPDHAAGLARMGDIIAGHQPR